MFRCTCIRHGHKRSDELDPRLSKLGHAQAELTARGLLDQQVSELWASPMRRTQQTAGYISQALDIKIHTDHRLKERMELGDLSERGVQKFLNNWAHATADRTYQPPSGDSSVMAGERVELLMEERARQVTDGHAVFVMHGGVIVDAVQTLFSDEVVAPLRKEFSFGWDYDIHECSLTEFVYDAAGWRLVRLNDWSHLVGLEAVRR